MNVYIHKSLFAPNIPRDNYQIPETYYTLNKILRNIGE